MAESAQDRLGCHTNPHILDSPARQQTIRATKKPRYTNNTNLVPRKRFMWYRMAVIQGFVPRKRFMWDKAATYKEIRGISAGPSSALYCFSISSLISRQAGERTLT